MAANGRRYSAPGTITSAATKTIVGITGGTTVRPAIFDLIVGFFSTRCGSAA